MAKKKASRKVRKVSKKLVKKAARKAKKPDVKYKQIKANMLATFDPSHRGIAEAELKTVLRQVGEIPRMQPTEADGLFKLQVKDARAAAKKISSLVLANPAIFVTTRHYIPIDAWVKSDLKSMQQAAKKASAGIAVNEKWKMALNKRHWDKMECTPLIIKLTDVVDRRRVDLENPEKVIQVEIIGKEAGISLLKPSEIVDVEKIKIKL